MIAKFVPLDLKGSIDTLEPHTDRQTDTHRETEGNIILQITWNKTKLYKLRVFFLSVMYFFFLRDVQKICVLKTINLRTGVRKHTADTKRNDHIANFHVRHSLCDEKL